MRRWIAAVVLIACGAPGAVADPAAWMAPGEAAGQRELEAELVDRVSPERLRAFHDATGSFPHRAGTEGDERVIAYLAESFESFGLEVETNRFDALLGEPVAGAVELVEPVRLALPVKERAVGPGALSGREGLEIGWNAYSGTGDVTSRVVYANYGRKADFERLAEWGVDVEGAVVIARYGGNFRGYKAKFAEEAGAAALVIYTDPDDAGWGRGLPWPEGGWANGSSIQRGSIKTLPYSGDPLTPFEPSSDPDAPRLSRDEVGLPTIPVQPIGWDAAREVLSRMTGRAVPDDGWQGGLPFRYRLESGDDLRVRVAVTQPRRVVRTANVLGTLRGSEHADQFVVVGGHHDAWAYGASDPLAGLIAVLECARVFGELAEEGIRPKRSIVFAGWGAEEHGIIGSTEWVEANRQRLIGHAVAYLNLDASAMGPNFRSASAPTLKAAIESAAEIVPHAGDPSVTVAEAARARGDGLSFGNLGGGSDHVGFYCHAGVPSASLGAGGADGSAYHTLYDHLEWYRAVVGDDYASARMVAQMTALTAAKLANATLLPIDPARYGRDAGGHLDAIAARAETLGVPVELEALRTDAARYAERAAETTARLRESVEDGALSPATVEHVNGLLLAQERLWLHPPGLPGRAWYRNLYAASDEDSGYASWMLPLLRAAVEREDPASASAAVEAYRGVFALLGQTLTAMEMLSKASPGAGEAGD